MTTEEDFQALLDRNPDDHTTRLILADWLEERGDVRAEGYRVLGLLPSRPELYSVGQWGYDRKGRFADSGDDLPGDWFLKMEEPPDFPLYHWSDQIRCAPSRREIEDIAARAFSKLPINRRKRLLKGTS